VAGITHLLESRRTLWGVLGLTIILWIVANLPWQLDDYDQAKQAFTSFEMVKEGHWFYQRTPNEKVATKPPLVGWISAGIHAGTNSWTLAWRLPSFLAALALLAFLCQTASKAYGAVAGLLATGAFGLNMLTLRLATLVRTDMPLALVTFLIGWQIWLKIRSDQPWTGHERRRIFLLLTAAMLIKGPIIYAFLLPGIALYQWRQRGRPGPNAWGAAWPWAVSLFVFLLWVLGGIVFVSGFFHEVVLKEFLGRFGETLHKPQPVYFYLPHLLQKFAPWSVLGLALAALAWKAGGMRLRNWWRNGSGELAWLVCWSVGGLIVMSLIPSKRVDRIYPIIPALCLLLAALSARLQVRENLRGRATIWTALALLLGGLGWAGYAVWKVDRAYRHDQGALVEFAKSVRAEAQAHDWRYEVMGGEQEGMLLYLQRSHFLKNDEVIAKWNAGEINAVVAPRRERAVLLRDLRGSVPSPLQSWRKGEKKAPHYILLLKSPQPVH
jgi:4-amino-4-deoxy-L-arabinose transferase-like glycosyltransferase